MCVYAKNMALGQVVTHFVGHVDTVWWGPARAGPRPSGRAGPGRARAYSESHSCFKIMVKDCPHSSIAIKSLFSML